MGGHARQQWMSDARQLTELMERFQLDPSDSHLEELCDQLRRYQKDVQKNAIQPPTLFKSF